ncbi:ER membrane protein complex subunit 8/9 homolog [Episyrphus balteatus]|uniref:ER membrane protein complex subunit 8/9 homolog n=1 Tax=Episyrphus balteatus TaxID=286459 RepID=UPI0024851A59|nr:ER membrane protein complex subunit 8/9 homolog [Episyrphus balteatus]
MEDYKISEKAYAKIIFHAAKYPHCAINGILLADKTTSGRNESVNIVDAIPLFHQCLYVTPMVEIALAQIEAMADSQDLIIAGYYGASENFYDASVEKVPAGKIADKIQENFKNACFVVIDNKFVCHAAEKPAIKVFSHGEGHWKKASFALVHCQNTLDAVKALLKRGAMKDIVDFDNHLDNPENDWTNQFLNRDLKQIMAMY